MRVLLYGKNSGSITDLVESYGLEVASENPEVIISYGGDGTLLTSEREYPSVPKLPIRDSKVCKKCSKHATETLLQSLAENKLVPEEVSKLETEFEGDRLLALNDIVLRNASSFHAVRFKLTKNDTPIGGEVIIGDGIVASTPFGSSGYFQSITRGSFTQNFQIAFNNTVSPISPLEFAQNDVIKITVIRGPAHLTSDNNPQIIELIEGNEFVIKPSDKKASIYSSESLRCTDCIILRDQRLG